MSTTLPLIPAKRYFTIGEVSELCDVKPYVLRYWEQEFGQLRPVKRKGNRRYYQHHEILLIRKIRGLLYDQGFTISGARVKLGDQISAAPREDRVNEDAGEIGTEQNPMGNQDDSAEPANNLAVADELRLLLGMLNPEK